jgi:pimeloyl-ACP methyl ester carboxylesterase
MIQPLRVIDHAQQRPVLRHLRQERQDRQSDQEPVRRGSRAQPERDSQRVALRTRQTLQRFMAERAGARRAVEIPGASHAAAVSHPEETADLILQAAALPATA